MKQTLNLLNYLIEMQRWKKYYSNKNNTFWKKKIILIDQPSIALIDFLCQKKEIDIQIVKVSWKKTETTDDKTHNVFFQGLEEKERQKWIP